MKTVGEVILFPGERGVLSLIDDFIEANSLQAIVLPLVQITKNFLHIIKMMINTSKSGLEGGEKIVYKEIMV